MNKLKKNCEVIRAIIDSYPTGIPKLTINNYAESFNVTLDEVDFVIDKILIPLREIEHLEKVNNESRKYLPVTTRAIQFESFYLLLSSKPTQLLKKEFNLISNIGYGRITKKINQDTLVQTYDSWLKIPRNQAIWYENKRAAFREMDITDIYDVGDFKYYCPWKTKKRENWFNFSDLDSSEKKMIHIVQNKIGAKFWLKFSKRPNGAHTLSFDDNNLNEKANIVRLFLRHQVFKENNKKSNNYIKKDNKENFCIDNIFLPDEEQAALVAFSDLEVDEYNKIIKFTFNADCFNVIEQILDKTTTNVYD